MLNGDPPFEAYIPVDAAPPAGYTRQRVITSRPPRKTGGAGGDQSSTDDAPAADERGEAMLERFRRLYLTVQRAHGRDITPTIGVTSAVAGEGRTTIAAGIASAMAADLDLPVALIEADLARPGLHRVLGFEPEPGVCEYLAGECELSEAFRQVADRLFALPAGDARGQAPRLVRQLANADFRARMRPSGALLVFDLPPILASSYGALAASMVEALIFVVRAGQTTGEQVREALGRLDGEAVRSVVLNAPDPQTPRWLGGERRERL